MHLNELRITSDAELEEWKKTWDGVSIPPIYIQEYMAVQFEERQLMYDKIINLIANENK